MEVNSLKDSSVTRSSISFTFQKKIQPPKGKALVQDDEKKDFVLSLAGNKIESTKPVSKEAVYIIPLKVGKQKKQQASVGQREGGASSENGKGRGEEKSEAELQLDREAAAAVLKDVLDAELRQHEVPEEEDSVISMMLRNKHDLLVGDGTQPQMSTEEEYGEMPINQFGKAMLRGMGWKEGVALGKNGEGLIEPIELIGRYKGLGLGAMPRPTEPPKRKRIKIQGEDQEEKVKGPYVDKDGRVKHYKNLGEAIPEQPLRGFVVGNYARVLVGQHEDLYGKIVKVEEKSKHVQLKMAINDQVLRFSQHHLELVSREEYRLGRPVEERDRAGSNGRERDTKRAGEKMFGLIVRKRKGRSDGDDSTRQPRVDPPNQKHSKTERDRHGNRDNGNDRKRTSGCHGDGSRHDDRHLHGDNRTEEASHYHSGGPSSTRLQGGGDTKHVSRAATVEKPVQLAREDHWLASNLIVKMANRTYKKGRHYNTKVVIVDVVSIGECVCRTEAGQLLEGVTQDMLETVVPKTQHPVVRIVRGKHKNNLATIIDQDRARAEAVIQLNLSKEVMNVNFDDICEYLVKEDEEDYLG